MEWIEGITWFEGRLAPQFVDTEGSRRSGELWGAQASLPRVRKVWSDARTFSMSSLVRCDARPYLDAFGFGSDVRDHHEMFRVDAGGMAHIIPAYLLVKALVAGTRMQLDDILRPSGTGHRVCVGFDGDAPVLQLKLKGLSEPHELGTLVEDRFIWLACFPSAQRMWNSVFLKAMRDATLGCELPMARVTARLSGKVVGKTKFVTDIVIIDVASEEAPFPFAAALKRSHFTFHNRKKMHSTSAAAAAARLKRLANSRSQVFKGDETLIAASGAIALNDREWTQAIQLLIEKGHQPTQATRARLNQVLEKYAGGMPWYRFEGWASLWSFQDQLRKSQALEAVLSLVRRIRGDERIAIPTTEVKTEPSSSTHPDGETITAKQVYVKASTRFVDSRSYLNNWSALHIHGLKACETSTVSIAASKARKNEVIDGWGYRYLHVPPARFFGYETRKLEEGDVIVSDLERTVLDSISIPVHCGGILGAGRILINAAPRLDWSKLHSYAMRLEKNSVRRRLGFLTEFFGLASEEVLEMLSEHLGPAYQLLDEAGEYVGPCDSRWGLKLNVEESDLKRALAARD